MTDLFHNSFYKSLSSWSDADRSTLIVEFYRSEMLNARCIAVSEEFWLKFKAAIELVVVGIKVDVVGIKVEELELHSPWGPIDNYHRLREVIDSVYEVQGMKRKEGEDCLPMLERLVSEYAKLK